MIRLTIPEPAPSWQQLYAGKHWTQRKRMADEWHLRVMAGLAMCRPLVEGRVDITVTANYPDKRRRDPDNICAKLLIDGLVHAGILPDDSDEYVASSKTRITRDRSRPVETVITITQEESC